MPALLKPAPRALAAQLWALKHGGPEVKGLDDLQRLASSGRTSLPVDKEVPKALYRTVGYRVCGERAVRVDILERLADLIRPALAWRDGSPGTKPPGAFDGGGFTVTQPMTSLTGSSGDDFASILRSLGYRMEKRPRPPEPPPSEAVPPTPPEMVAGAETAAADEGAGADAGPSEAAASHDDAHFGTADLLPAPDLVPAPAGEPDTVAMGVAPVVPQQDTAEAAGALPEADESPVVESPLSPIEGDAVSASGEVAAEGHSDVDPVSAGAAGEAPVAAEPDVASGSSEHGAKPPSAADDAGFVEVWRPGWSDERRPRRHVRGGKRPADAHAPQPDGGAAAETPAPADASAASPEAGTQEGPRRHGRHGRHDRPRDGSERPREGRGERPREGRSERPRGGDRPYRGDRPRDGQRPPRSDRRDDRREEGRVFATSQKARRDKEPDPDSPFAKLAALKAQLEANTKDGR